MLTPTERRILLDLSVKGGSRKSVAEAHNISPRTVDTHCRKIYMKLGVHKRKDAVAKARQEGLI